MVSLHVKILLILACVSIVYAFVCNIRLTRKATELASWVGNVHPELWKELNYVARTWNGGHPGLKLIYRKQAIVDQGFIRQYMELQALERKLISGVAFGSFCIGLVIIGARFWGWQI